MVPKTKIYTLGDRSLRFSSFDLHRKNKQLEGHALKWQLAYFAAFFKISTNLFCPVFTLRLIGKPNKKSIGPKSKIKPSKSHTNGHISFRVFFPLNVY